MSQVLACQKKGHGTWQRNWTPKLCAGALHLCSRISHIWTADHGQLFPTSFEPRQHQLCVQKKQHGLGDALWISTCSIDLILSRYLYYEYINTHQGSLYVYICQSLTSVNPHYIIYIYNILYIYIHTVFIDLSIYQLWVSHVAYYLTSTPIDTLIRNTENPSPHINRNCLKQLWDTLPKCIMMAPISMSISLNNLEVVQAKTHAELQPPPSCSCIACI